LNAYERAILQSCFLALCVQAALRSLMRNDTECLNTWFNRAYPQDCVHVMRVISGLSEFKGVWLLALVHARTRASKHLYVQECVFVIMLLLKLVFLKASGKFT
jgi:hypothetical protein